MQQYARNHYQYISLRYVRMSPSSQTYPDSMDIPHVLFCRLELRVAILGGYIPGLLLGIADIAVVEMGDLVVCDLLRRATHCRVGAVCGCHRHVSCFLQDLSRSGLR